MELHHFAYKIRPNTLETTIEFFDQLGLKLSYREGDARWALVESTQKNVEIQLIETAEQVLGVEEKLTTHIAFATPNPQIEMQNLEQWLKQKGVKVNRGQWNEEMLWLDLPEIFVNFVIELISFSAIGRC